MNEWFSEIVSSMWFLQPNFLLLKIIIVMKILKHKKKGGSLRETCMDMSRHKLFIVDPIRTIVYHVKDFMFSQTHFRPKPS